MKHRFTSDYSHRWPSGAHTEYKKGMVMTLKREVVERATALKVIEPVKRGQ
jgi:hypothetical protein